MNIREKTINNKKGKWRSENKQKERKTQKLALLAHEREIAPKRYGKINKEDGPMKPG